MPGDDIVGGGHGWVWLCAGGLLRVVRAGVWCGLWWGQGMGPARFRLLGACWAAFVSRSAKSGSGTDAGAGGLQ